MAMRPFQVRIDLEGEERSTKAKVCYHEGDTEEQEGRSAEITVYVDRRGLRMPEISDAAVRCAEEFLRRILNDSQGVHES